MRIVYVLTSLGVGGAERQVLALAARMAAHHHKVVLLVLRPVLEEQCPTSLEVIHLNMRRNALSVLVGLRRASRFLGAFNPDVVHSHSFHANMIARMLKAQVPSLAVVCTVHNVYEGGRARMLAYRLTDRLSSLTTAVSAAAIERFVRLKAVSRRKCVVLTNGIDTREFAPQERRRAATRSAMGVGNKFVWISVGRVVPAKDYPNLMRAFGRLHDSAEKAQLWIAGAGRPEGVAPAMEGADEIRWLGLRRDVAALMDAADGFVLASAWEGMPLAMGEAMAMEKPVVATDVGGVREMVGDAGLLVPAADSVALAAAMQRVMNLSAKERQSLGRRARERIVNGFSMDARAAEWEGLYRSIQEAQPAGPKLAASAH